MTVRIDTHEGLFVDPAGPDDVARAVRSLTAVGEAFIIMSPSPESETYVQAAGTPDEAFIIERRDGCAGEHYRGDRRVTADELIRLLIGYLAGTADWSRLLSWHRVRVGAGPANDN